MNTNNAWKMSLISVIVKFLGLIKLILFSYFFGTSNISDAFNIALIIPDTLYTLISTGLNSTYVPMANQEKSETNLNKFTSGIIILISFITIISCILCVFLCKFIVKIIAPGFSDETNYLAVKLIIICIWGIIFYGLSNVFISYLQIKGKFVVAELSLLILNICQCISIVFAHYTNNKILAYGILIGSILQTIILLIILKINKFKFSFNLLDKIKIKTVLKLSFPIFLSASANRINVLIDKAIASKIQEGAISALSYADNILLFLKSIFGMPIITIIFPTISLLMIKGDNIRINKIIGESMEKIAFYILPITFGCMILSPNIVKLLYGRGAFDENSINLTSGCLLCYVIGLIAFCYRDLFVKVYYSQKNTIRPTINMFIGIFINIPLNYILSYFLGIKGLALASSVTGFIIMFLMGFNLRKTINFNQIKYNLYKILKILISSLVMAFIVKIILKYVFNINNNIIKCLLSILIGAISYFSMLYLLRTYNFDDFKKRILMK